MRNNLMEFIEVTSLFVMGLGVIGVALGLYFRQRGGWPVVAIGLAFVIGPLSPLTKDLLSDSVRIGFSLAAVLLSVTGAIVSLTTRRAQAR